MKKNLWLILSLLLVIAAASVAIAQSGDRDHPTPINSNELRGVLAGNGGESFYSFTAGPGELTITVEVKSTDGTLAMPFELLEANAADSILCCEFAQAGATGETGRAVKPSKSEAGELSFFTLLNTNTGQALSRFDLAARSGSQADRSRRKAIGSATTALLAGWACPQAAHCTSG